MVTDMLQKHPLLVTHTHTHRDRRYAVYDPVTETTVCGRLLWRTEQYSPLLYFLHGCVFLNAKVAVTITQTVGKAQPIRERKQNTR